jgi:uncharacterized protein YndB with AHSA1/START domain
MGNGSAAKANEIRIVRVYDAPVKAVWEAWTDPAQVAQWWGPRGFTITTHSKDLRVGGHWRYTMHGPDGKDWPNVTKYLEVEEGKKLVYDHGGTDGKPALFRVTVLFSEAGKGKTRMEMTMGLATAEAAAETRKFIKKAGGDGTWDRLAEFVEKGQRGREVFVIARSFETSVERMFAMWTEAEHFVKWLPPTGFTMRILEGDLRVGGEAFYVMEGSGMKMFGRVKYLEMTRPVGGVGRVVYTQQFCDEQGGISRHPMVPVWPETMVSRVEMVEEEAGRTRVVVTWEPAAGATAEEVAVFVGMRGSMTMGWTGSFDKLEGVLG